MGEHRSVYDALADQYCRCAVGKCQGLRIDQCANRHAPRVIELEAENARLRERVAELEQATRWIPVGERLPTEPHRPILALYDDGDIVLWNSTKLMDGKDYVHAWFPVDTLRIPQPEEDWTKRHGERDKHIADNAEEMHNNAITSLQAELDDAYARVAELEKFTAPSDLDLVAIVHADKSIDWHGAMYAVNEAADSMEDAEDTLHTIELPDGSRALVDLGAGCNALCTVTPTPAPEGGSDG